MFGWSSRVALTLEKTIKTAFGFSIIDFYFVTGFYSFDNICMVDRKTFFRQEDMKTCFILPLNCNISVRCTENMSSCLPVKKPVFMSEMILRADA